MSVEALQKQTSVSMLKTLSFASVVFLCAALGFFTCSFLFYDLSALR